MSRNIAPVIDVLPESSRVPFAFYWLQLNSLQQKFLMGYVEKAGSIRGAAEKAGVSVNVHYNWMASHEAYATLFSMYKERAVQMLEDEAIRRAVEGVDEPVFFQGQ